MCGSVKPSTYHISVQRLLELQYTPGLVEVYQFGSLVFNSSFFNSSLKSLSLLLGLGRSVTSILSISVSVPLCVSLCICLSWCQESNLGPHTRNHSSTIEINPRSLFLWSLVQCDFAITQRSNHYSQSRRNILTTMYMFYPSTYTKLWLDVKERKYRKPRFTKRNKSA